VLLQQQQLVASARQSALLDINSKLLALRARRTPCARRSCSRVAVRVVDRPDEADGHGDGELAPATYNVVIDQLARANVKRRRRRLANPCSPRPTPATACTRSARPS